MDLILIIEDDLRLNQGLCRALNNEKTRTIPCLDIQTAREKVLLISPSIIILDVNLPDGSGIDFLKELKQLLPSVPIILLTANDTDIEIVHGLESGADDYITKPFSLSVLRARVNTQLRKAKNLQHEKVIRIDHFVFDFQNMVFTANESVIELSKTEQKLLRMLIENAGSILKRDVLIDRIWTDGAEYVDENALSVAVKRLRDKLGAQEYIKTVYGVGYSWVEHHE